MNAPDLARVLSRVTFKDWTPIMRSVATEGRVTGYLLWWTFRTLVKGEFQQQFTRKWHISRHATESEVVQTLLLAALQAVEHEAREDFRIDGVQAYGPHINVYALKAAARMLDVRHELPTPNAIAAAEVAWRTGVGAECECNPRFTCRYCLDKAASRNTARTNHT